jgi:hypothetical protein
MLICICKAKFWEGFPSTYKRLDEFARSPNRFLFLKICFNKEMLNHDSSDALRLRQAVVSELVQTLDPSRVKDLGSVGEIEEMGGVVTVLGGKALVSSYRAHRVVDVVVMGNQYGDGTKAAAVYLDEPSTPHLYTLNPRIKQPIGHSLEEDRRVLEVLRAADYRWELSWMAKAAMMLKPGDWL